MRNFGTERNGEKYVKKVYELKKFSAEIKNSEINGKDDLIPGCTIERDQDPKPIQKFYNPEIALAELQKMPKATAKYMSWTIPFWAVEEYAIEIYEENEEGDFVNGSDFETQDEMEILD